MLIDRLFWFHPCFAIDGENGGGGENENENENTDDGDSKNEDAGNENKNESKKIEVDEKEYSELKGLREKVGEDFDADKWGKLKAFEVEKVIENMKFGDAVEKDALLRAVLQERIDAKKAGRKVNLATILKNFEAEIDNGDGKPPVKKKDASGKEVPADPRVEELYKEKVEREAKDAQKSFDDALDRHIKDSKIKLTEREKRSLKTFVESVYVQKIMADAKYNPDYKDIGAEVKKAMVEIEAYRKEVLGDAYKEIKEGADDESPDGLSGGKPNVPQKKYDPKKASREERHAAIADEVKSFGQG